MIDFSINLQKSQILQNKNGLFVNDRPFLPIVIISITSHYHFISYSNYRKEYKVEIIELASYFPDTPLILTYDEEKPEKFLHALKEYGLKSDFLPKDSIKIWSLIVNSSHTGLSKNPCIVTSENTGWILFQNRHLYMTSQFAISKKEYILKYHCTNPKATILYDKEMNSSEAFRETMNIIEFDFNEIMPIWITNILSLLQPIIDKENLYYIPGLFISGATSTGKTELALAFGTLFERPSANSIKNFFILQDNKKKLNNAKEGFSDTTFILDDARKPKAAYIKDSITSSIEFFSRPAFAKSDIKLTPIITGEPKIFNEHLISLRNRYVEVYLHSTQDKMLIRKKIISRIKSDFYPLKTCLIHFIKFICRLLDSPKRINYLISSIKKDFQENELSKNKADRSSDNLFLHYFAFKLFMHFAEDCCNLSLKDAKEYENQYIKSLTIIKQYTNFFTEDGQIEMFIYFLCNAIKKKAIKIHTPDILECYFYTTDNTRYGFPSIKNTYGNGSIIDITSNFHGVYLRNRSNLFKYPQNSTTSPVLLINVKSLHKAIEMENENYYEQFGFNALTTSLSAYNFKQLLASKKVLCVENRNEQGHKNYSCNYPHYSNGTIIEDSVWVINMNSPYTKKIIKCINSISFEEEFPRDCLYSSQTPFNEEVLKKCNIISSFHPSFI